MFPRRGSCQLSISYHFTVFSVVGQQCVKLTELCHRLARMMIFFYFRYWCLFTSQNGGGKACSLPPTNPSDTTYGYVTHSNLCQDCVILIIFIFSFGADGHIWSCLHPGASELCGLQQHNRNISEIIVLLVAETNDNFTAGTKIICQARGVPLPNITWTKSNGEPIGTVPGLRQVSYWFYSNYWQFPVTRWCLFFLAYIREPLPLQNSCRMNFPFTLETVNISPWW